MAGTYNFTWVQGEDLDIEFVYKKGDPTPTPVNLTGHTLKMSIGEHGKTPEFTVTSPDPSIVMGTTTGKVNITLNRNILLQPVPGQETNNLYDRISGSLGLNTFVYEIFLIDSGGKPTKVLRGEIYVERSISTWP